MNPQVYTAGTPRRFVILVPRIAVAHPTDSHRSASASLMQSATVRKALVVVGLVLAVAVFAALRFCCRHLVGRASKHSQQPMYLGCDTFARALGISAGAWDPRSTSGAERQLLCVIAVFSMLAGSVFLGSLYEEFVAEEPVRWRYNSLDEVCRDQLDLSIPYELLAHFARDAAQKLMTYISL